MLSSASLALNQISSPPFRAVLLKAVALTLAMLAAAWAALYAAFVHFVTVPWGWLETVLDVLTGVGLVIGLVFLIAPVTAMFAGLFLDDVAAAVSALLHGGADAFRKNGNGSTPMMLATRQTGRGGSGSPEAKMQQAEIIRLLERYGATP